MKDREWPHILTQLYATALSVLSLETAYSLFLRRNSTLFTEDKSLHSASYSFATLRARDDEISGA